MKLCLDAWFGCLKNRGFDFEATHMTSINRLEKYLFILTLTVGWCLKMGIWKNQKSPIKKKKHGRLSKSLFRYGLDALQEALTEKIDLELFVHGALRI